MESHPKLISKNCHFKGNNLYILFAIAATGFMLFVYIVLFYTNPECFPFYYSLGANLGTLLYGNHFDNIPMQLTAILGCNNDTFFLLKL